MAHETIPAGTEISSTIIIVMLSQGRVRHSFKQYMTV